MYQAGREGGREGPTYIMTSKIQLSTHTQKPFGGMAWGKGEAQNEVMGQNEVTGWGEGEGGTCHYGPIVSTPTNHRDER